MSFPIWYLLLVYGLFLAIAGLFFLFNFFHIAKFGLQNFKTALVLMLYVGAFAIVLLLNLQLISLFDWTQTIDVSSFSMTIPSL